MDRRYFTRREMGEYVAGKWLYRRGAGRSMTDSKSPSKAPVSNFNNFPGKSFGKASIRLLPAAQKP